MGAAIIATASAIVGEMITPVLVPSVVTITTDQASATIKEEIVAGDGVVEEITMKSTTIVTEISLKEEEEAKKKKEEEDDNEGRISLC